MEIRSILPEEMQAASDLSSQAFSNGEIRKYTSSTDKRAVDRYGLFDEDGLAAKVAVIQYQIHLGAGKIAEMGGVAGVACYPEKRGRGYVGMLLKYSLEQMRAQGQSISMLFPFSQAFYRKYGWEWAGEVRRYSVPTHIFNPSQETEKVRRASVTDTEAIKECYTSVANRYRGMIFRNDSEWLNLLQGGDKLTNYIYVYAPEGEVRGYLIMKEGIREKTSIREFLCTDIVAHKALLGMLRRMNMQVEHFKWKAPSDDLTWWSLGHDDVNTRVTPVCMVRIVDVRKAISLLNPSNSNSGNFSFLVKDEYAPWNSVSWKVGCTDDALTVEQSNTDPDFELSIQALSQCYLGTPNTSQVRSAGGITVFNEEGFHSFEQLLNGSPMYLADAF